MNKPEYCRKIELFIYNLKNDDSFNYKISYSNKKEFLEDLKKYIKNNLTEENKIYVDILYKYAISDREDKYCIFSLKDEPDYMYIEIISNILSTYKTNKEEAFKIALDTLDKYTKYPDALSKFNSKFFNAVLYKDILNEVLREVCIRSEQAKDKRTTYVDNDALHHTNDKLYLDVYESGLSLRDYAHLHFIDSAAHKRYFNPAGVGCNKKLADELLSRKDTCTGELLDIIEKIKNGEIEDAIDYYSLTKYNPLYLKKLAVEYGVELNVNFSKFVRFNSHPCHEMYMVEAQVREPMKINNQEVSYNIKEEAKKKMEKMGMPMMASYHKQFVRKLLKSK